MLGYLNGLGRSKNNGSTKKRNILKKALAFYPPAIALKLAKKALAKNKNGSTTQRKTIIKKAFSLLPPVMAVNLVKNVIARNKNKPRAASQNTQHRALKNALAQQKAQTFIKKNKTLFLDDADLNETPATEQNIIDDQIDQEVENEIETEEAFEENQADLGVYYPCSIGDKASRKAKKEAKTDKIKAKADAKRMKGEAKVNRSNRPRASFKDISSGILDTVKTGAGIFKDLKGGGAGSGDETLPTEKQESFISKNKTLLIVGGVVLLGGTFLLMKKKGK